MCHPETKSGKAKEKQEIQTLVTEHFSESCRHAYGGACACTYGGAWEDLYKQTYDTYRQQGEKLDEVRAHNKALYGALQDALLRFQGFQCDQGCGELWSLCECPDGKWYRDAIKTLHQQKDQARSRVD